MPALPAPRILRFVPASKLDPNQFAFQARMTFDSQPSRANEPEKFVLDQESLGKQELIVGTCFCYNWMQAFGAKKVLTTGQKFKVNILAIKVGSGNDYFDHEDRNHPHQHRYTFELYEIVQGSIHVSCDENFSWPVVWPKDSIRKVTYGTSSFHLDITRESRLHHVGWLSNMQNEQSSPRFWEMLSCGDSDPASYVRERLQGVKAPSKIRIFSQSEAQPRVIFRDDRLENSAPKELLVPDVGIEFQTLDQRPQWIPRSVQVNGDQFIFRDSSPFESESEVSNPIEVIWNDNAEPMLNELPDLPLVDSSLPVANSNQILWHYTYFGTRPAWVSYPLPSAAPQLRDTDPLAIGLTSGLNIPVKLGDAQWSLSLAPLLQETFQPANMEMTFNVKTAKANLKINNERFDVLFQSPEIFFYGERLVDGKLVPSPTNLSASLKQASLRFANSIQKGSVTVKVDNQKAVLKTTDPLHAYQASETPLLRYVSPAGNNLLVIPENGGSIVTLPDTTRGLLQLEISGQFDIVFSDLNKVNDQEFFGKVTSVSSMAMNVNAIHGLFPWMELQWTASGTMRELYHRNLILEPIEFFKRLREQQRQGQHDPFIWNDGHVKKFTRDAFSLAAKIIDNDPKEVENFLKNAVINVRPKVKFDESSDWPKVEEVALGGGQLFVKTKEDKNNPKWLPFISTVDKFDGDFPSIELNPAASLQSAFQPLVGDGKSNKVFDNAGVTRECKVESGDRVRLQTIHCNGETLYSLDCETAIRTNDNEDIRIVCYGLILKELPAVTTGSRKLTPVSTPVSELGDLGCYRIFGKQKLGGAFSWPTLGHYPLIPFALTSITIADSQSKLSIESIDFEGILPSPRDVAFPDTTEFSPAARRAAALGKVTVKCSSSAVKATGIVNWQLSPETSDGSLVVGGPVSLYGPADYSSVSPFWTIRNGKGDVAVFGQLQKNVDFGDLVSSYTGENVEFQTDTTSVKLSYSTLPKKLPTFTFESLYLDDKLIAKIECKSKGDNEVVCTATLTTPDTGRWVLEAIHDHIFGFVSENADKALSLWYENSFNYRQWSEKTENKTINLIVKGGPAIQLEGTVSEFVIADTKNDKKRRFISAILKSKEDTASPIQLLIVSQEYDPSKTSSTISAQITIGDETSNRIAGTVLLQPKEGNGAITGLEISDVIYDLTPATRIVDRTSTDVIVPVEGTAIDLIPFAPTRFPNARSAFFAWTYGLSPVIKKLKSLILENFTSSNLLTAVSNRGKIFIAAEDGKIGYLIDIGEAIRVELQTEIKDVDFRGENVLLATATKTLLFKDGKLVDVTPLSSDKITGIRTDPKNDSHLWIFDGDGKRGRSVGGSSTSTFSFLSPKTLLSAARLRNNNQNFEIGFFREKSSNPMPLKFLFRSETRIVPNIREGVVAATNEHFETVAFAATTWNNFQECYFVCATPSEIKFCSLQNLNSDNNVLVRFNEGTAKTAVDVSLVGKGERFFITVAYGEKAPAELLILEKSSGSTYNLVQKISLEMANKVDLVALGDRLNVYLTRLKESDKFELTILQLAPGLTFRSADVPIDRCTDSNLTRPPEDQSLSAPQSWHLRADGRQLMSGMSSWKPFLREDDSLGDPLSLSLNDWLVGPLMDTGDRYQVVRTDLALNISPTDLNEPLSTDTLLAVSREQDIGVLYNQTSNNSNEGELKKVLKRRQWHGMSLVRTMDSAGSSKFSYLILRPDSKRMFLGQSDIRSIRSANSDNTDKMKPDSRLLPIDQFRVSFFDISPNLTYLPAPELIPGETSPEEHLRSWKLKRMTGTLPATGDAAEVLFSQIAAFPSMPRRHRVPEYSMKPHDSNDPEFKKSTSARVFLPQNLEWKHGAGKPGAMISHRIQPIVYHQPPKANLDAPALSPIENHSLPASLAMLRDTMRLAGLSTPRITGLDVTTSDVTIAGKTLQFHKRLKSKWRIETLPLTIDNEKFGKEQLTRPDGEYFIVKNGDNFDFANKNRRLFALVSGVDGQLLEVPQFHLEDTIVKRDPNSDKSLPIQLRSQIDNGREQLVPQLFLVSHADLSSDLGVKGDETKYEVKIVVVSEVSTTYSFTDLFEMVDTQSVPYVFCAKSKPDVLRSGVKFLIILHPKSGTARKNGTAHKLIPWAIGGVSEAGGADLTLRVSMVGETHSHLVAKYETQKSVFVSFEQAGGEDFKRRDALELELDENKLNAKLVDNYSIETDIDSTNLKKVQVLVVLPNGEAIGEAFGEAIGEVGVPAAELATTLPLEGVCSMEDR